MGDAGATCTQALAGSLGMSGFEVVVASYNGASALFAACPDGKKTISGGCISNGITARLRSCGPETEMGPGVFKHWMASYHDVDPVVTITVHVFCISQ